MPPLPLAAMIIKVGFTAIIRATWLRQKAWTLVDSQPHFTRVFIEFQLSDFPGITEPQLRMKQFLRNIHAAEHSMPIHSK